MDLLPSAEQKETIAAVASYMGDKLPASRFQNIAHERVDRPGRALTEVAEHERSALQTREKRRNIGPSHRCRG